MKRDIGKSIMNNIPKNIVLVTKDALRKNDIGNSIYFSTPNISELAKKGTIFTKHYTAAPSSAMSYTSMFSGLYAHELKRKRYSEVEPFQESETLFDVMESNHFHCHIVWDKVWYKTAYLHSKVYGSKTSFHNLNIQRGVGPHVKYTDPSPKDKDRARNEIRSRIESILQKASSNFIWVHLPHVLSGYTGYGSDIDMMDNIIGDTRKMFSDSAIYISSDHGHMNMEKGIPVYGHHLYESAINIPLITPRIGEYASIDFPTSHTQLKDIITNGYVDKKRYIYVDTQYYQQSNRKLAIIKGQYKYIYNKRRNVEELYDLEYDPKETVNLLAIKVYDRNRKVSYRVKEIYYYPKYGQVKSLLCEMRGEKTRIWRQGHRIVEKSYQLNKFRKNIRRHLFSVFEKTSARFGIEGSKVDNVHYRE